MDSGRSGQSHLARRCGRVTPLSHPHVHRLQYREELGDGFARDRIVREQDDCPSLVLKSSHADVELGRSTAILEDSSIKALQLFGDESRERRNTKVDMEH